MQSQVMSISRIGSRWSPALRDYQTILRPANACNLDTWIDLRPGLHIEVQPKYDMQHSPWAHVVYHLGGHGQDSLPPKLRGPSGRVRMHQILYHVPYSRDTPDKKSCKNIHLLVAATYLSHPDPFKNNEHHDTEPHLIHQNHMAKIHQRWSHSNHNPKVFPVRG